MNGGGKERESRRRWLLGLAVCVLLTGCTARPDPKAVFREQQAQLFRDAYAAWKADEVARAAGLFQAYLQGDTACVFVDHDVYAFAAACLRRESLVDSGRKVLEAGRARARAEPARFLDGAADELEAWLGIYPRFPKDLTPEGGFALEDTPPILTGMLPAAYPESARQRYAAGTVQHKALIDENGQVRKAEVFRSVDPELDAAAYRTVMGATFRAGLHHGRPARFWVLVPVRYSLH